MCSAGLISIEQNGLVAMARFPSMFVIFLIYFLITEQGISAISRFKRKDVIAPTSDSSTIYVNELIPKECEELGFCQESKNYPEELMQTLIKELRITNMTIDNDGEDDIFYDDEYYVEQQLFEEYGKELVWNSMADYVSGDRSLFIQPRFGGDDPSLQNPCEVDGGTVKPLIVRSLLDGKWYYVLNSRTNPIQTYRVKICKTTNSTAHSKTKCNSVFSLTNSYQSQCVQKFITHTTIVQKENKTIVIPVQIPCCCTCVAV